MIRREWRQQLGVLVLMTVAVAGAVAGAAMATQADGALEQWGGARAVVQIDNSDPARGAETVEAARHRFRDTEVVRHAPTTVPGTSEVLDVRSQDPQGRYGR
jgi:hypothetical protein